MTLAHGIRTFMFCLREDKELWECNFMVRPRIYGYAFIRHIMLPSSNYNWYIPAYIKNITEISLHNWVKLLLNISILINI